MLQASKHIRETENSFRENSNERGSSSLLIIIMLFGVTFSVTSIMSRQSARDLSLIQHEELKVDRLLLNRALSYQAVCPATGSYSCSTVGDGLEIDDLNGNTLIRNSNDPVQQSRIGKWNVRIRCDGSEFQTEVARCQPSGGGNFNCSNFLKNPSTGRDDSWRRLGTSLEDLCVPERQVVYAPPCYGADTGTLNGSALGRTQLPPELVAACNSTAPETCTFNGTVTPPPSAAPIYHGGYSYCPNNLGNYPTCPSGYRAELKVIDRFGWGGLDFTKFTVCVRINMRVKK